VGACLDEATARERATDPAALAHATTCERCAKLIERATQERAESATAISPARKEKRRAKPIDGALSRATLVGRYLILEPLGEGGMGIVYAAYDPDLDRKIALKLVRAGHAGSSDEQQRLLREAQAMAKLSHPNVLPIFDVGTFGERVFLAIEFVDGTTLRRWLRQEPRAWREALAVLDQIVAPADRDLDRPVVRLAHRVGEGAARVVPAHGVVLDGMAQPRHGHLRIARDAELRDPAGIDPAKA